MNEFEAWEALLIQKRRLQRRERLNQELYDMLGGSFTYLINYAKQHGIVLPDVDRLFRMADRIHALIEEINSEMELIDPPNESLQGGDQTDIGQNLHIGAVNTDGHAGGC